MQITEWSDSRATGFLQSLGFDRRGPGTLRRAAIACRERKSKAAALFTGASDRVTWQRPRMAGPIGQRGSSLRRQVVMIIVTDVLQAFCPRLD